MKRHKNHWRGKMYKFIEKMKNNLPLGEIGEELLNECVKLKARIEQQSSNQG